MVLHYDLGWNKKCLLPFYISLVENLVYLFIHIILIQTCLFTFIKWRIIFVNRILIDWSEVKCLIEYLWGKYRIVLFVRIFIIIIWFFNMNFVILSHLPLKCSHQFGILGSICNISFSIQDYTCMIIFSHLQLTCSHRFGILGSIVTLALQYKITLAWFRESLGAENESTSLFDCLILYFVYCVMCYVLTF